MTRRALRSNSTCWSFAPHPQTRNLLLEIPLHKCPLGAPDFGSGGRTLGLLLDSLHLLVSEPYCVLQRRDALLDAVAREFLVEIILVDSKRQGRRTARRSQARLHHAAGYLAAFVKERRDLLLRWHL
jgi:hypothetical protein